MPTTRTVYFMMEWWEEEGVLEYWSDGVVEWWSDGVME
jgi:hypothetical protein